MGDRDNGGQDEEGMRGTRERKLKKFSEIYIRMYGREMRSIGMGVYTLYYFFLI